MSQPCVVIVQIGETSNAELDSIIQQIKEIKYKGNVHSANVLWKSLNRRAAVLKANIVRPASPVNSR